MPAYKKTLIIIPTYNERENIVLIIPEIKKWLPSTHILVVDDSSPDGTSQCVKDLSENIENVFILDREKRKGWVKHTLAVLNGHLATTMT